MDFFIAIVEINEDYYDSLILCKDLARLHCKFKISVLVSKCQISFDARTTD